MARITNWSAAVGAAFMATTAITPCGLVAFGFLSQIDSDGRILLGTYGLIHVACAVVLCLRATARSSGYSFRTLMVTALVTGLYTAGIIYGSMDNPPTGVEKSPAWVAGIPALLAAIALAWSVARDRKDFSSAAEAASIAEGEDGADAS